MTPPTPREDVLQTQKLEALGKLAGGIAHDFNNILSIIEAHTEAAVRELKSGTLTPDKLRKILSSTERGAGLTRQLLAFSKQRIGIEDTIDLAKSLREQKALLSPLFGETIRLNLTVPNEPLWVTASEDLLTQIVLNLALNAKDALPSGGEVSISCLRCHAARLPEQAARKLKGCNDILRLTVTDNGTGIMPSVLPRIFDPFFTTKEPGRGTGLGLSVVHGVVEQLGGAIDVRTHPGEGTAFDVYLPMAKAPAKSSLLLPDAPAVSLKDKTVLLAEDEPELRDALALMLSSMEMKVMKASNGNHAFEMQDSYGAEIDFLLTDVVMPEMGGVELGKLFAEKRPGTNVVYMSGYPFLDGKKETSLHPSDFFISKPVQEDTVRQVLQRALQRRDERLQEDPPPSGEK